MPPSDMDQDDKPVSPIWGHVAPFGFGLAILLFLTVIERQRWFEIKPATGTAKAMAFAGERKTTQMN